MTYQAYDINGYTFYTEERDKGGDYQNSSITMVSYTGEEKKRYYRKIEEIWELDYIGEKLPMFCVRWATNITKEDGYFTNMCIPEANKSNTKNPTVQNEPWVLARHVEQCFFITDLSRPSRVFVRSGKMAHIGMDGVADKQDFDGLVGDLMMEESDEDDATYTKRRSRTTLPRTGVPYTRRSHDMGGQVFNNDDQERQFAETKMSVMHRNATNSITMICIDLQLKMYKFRTHILIFINYIFLV
jgi:hypothetical protein